MKGVLFLLFLFLSQGLYAQSECDTLKAIHSSYVYLKHNSKYGVQFNSFIVYEVGSKLEDTPQGDFVMYPYPTMFLKNMDVLSRLLKENIKPYLKPEYADSKKFFRFDLYFDEQGKILELYFTYQQDLIIPVVAIENLDRGIKEHCYIAINGSKVIFEGANYHRYILCYSLKDILNDNIPEEDLNVRLWW